MFKNRQILFVFCAAFLFSSLAWAGGEAGFHRTTILLISIFFVAKVAGGLCERIGIPSLIGELLGGIFLGNLAFFGMESELSSQIQKSDFLVYAAELGVVFLLFVVGLESSIKGLLHAGVDSFVTACVGVILPVCAGYVLIRALGMGGGIEAWFVGATFAATSVGITAKMLTQYGKLKSPSAQVILGAAVIDDVLGLILLAALAGVVETGMFSLGQLGWIMGKTLVFFAGAFLVGHYFMPHIFRLYKFIDHPGLITVIGILIALLFADMAFMVGLAPIVGAFTAGILLDEVQLRHTDGLTRHNFEQAMKPVMEMLLPIFFVSIGIQVQLNTFSSWRATGLVVLLLVIACLTKMVCGALVKGKGTDKLGIGLGMIPRGEVGLIFATYGLQHQILNGELYSILVMVVLLTTILGPMILKLRLSKF